MTRPAPPTGAEAPRYVWSPLLDFLCLGGASFLILPALVLLNEGALSPKRLLAAYLIAFVVNYPHFAVSYQIFYGGFRAKAFAGSDADLRARYVLAGIVVPVALTAFLAVAIAAGDARLLGLTGNAMGFLVGWHYAKQGYGILMVDAALKRRFFKATQKRILLVNSYTVWVLSWLVLNMKLSTTTIAGISYVTIPVPTPIIVAAAAIAAVTTALTIVVLAQAWRAGRLPVNGAVAYVVPLYLWLMLARATSFWALMVPAMHSLQYLLVAGRYKVNQVKAEAAASGGTEVPAVTRSVSRLWRQRVPLRLLGFAVLAVVLGALGFWGLPIAADFYVPYDRAALGSSQVFLFAAWIFINVHHYFLDNVIWRSANPDVKRYLFS